MDDKQVTVEQGSPKQDTAAAGMDADASSRPAVSVVFKKNITIKKDYVTHSF